MAFVTISYAKTVDVSDGWKNPKHVSLDVKYRKDEISPSLNNIESNKVTKEGEGPPPRD